MGGGGEKGGGVRIDERMYDGSVWERGGGEGGEIEVTQQEMENGGKQ